MQILTFGRTTQLLLVLGSLLASPALFGATLLYETFENPAGLADGNWQVIGSSQIVVDPQDASNHALKFNSRASGGDLFSVSLPYASAPGYAGKLFLSFDFLHTSGTDLHGYIGTDHQFSCCGPEQWLWSNDPNQTPFGTAAVPANTWTHVSFAFTPYDPGNTGTIVLKLEGVTNVDFFDNVVLSTTAPEPATLTVYGLGLTALLILKMRKRQ